LRVFSEKGFGGASIRRISDEAGLNSPPLVYWYFESKQDLFAATLAHFSKRLGGFAFGDRMESPPEELLPELARAELRAFRDPALVRLLRVAVAESALDPASGQRFVTVFRGEVLDFLTRYLQRWAEKTGHQDFHSRTEARAFFGALFFYVLNRELFPSVGEELPNPDEYADAVARRVLDRFDILSHEDSGRQVASVPPSSSREFAAADVPAGPRGEETLVPGAENVLPELEPVETEPHAEREAEPEVISEVEAPLSAGEIVGEPLAGATMETGDAEAARSGAELEGAGEATSPNLRDADGETEMTGALGSSGRHEEVEEAAREEPGEDRVPEDERRRAVGRTGDDDTEVDPKSAEDESGVGEREERSEWTTGLFDELSRERPALAPPPGAPPELPPKPEIPLFDSAASRAERAASRRPAASGDRSEAATGDVGLEDSSSEGRPPWVARGERLRDLEDQRTSGSDVPEERGEPEPSEGQRGSPEPVEERQYTSLRPEASPEAGAPSVAALESGRSEPLAPQQLFPAEQPAPTEGIASMGASGAREAGDGGVKKVLFFVLPVRGHVQAALPIARELASRGEEVVFYTTEEFEGLVRGSGVGFRALGDDFVLPRELSEGYFAASRDLRPAVVRSIADSLRGVGHLAGWAADEGADYAVYDPLCPWGRLIPEALGLPLVALYPTFVARENSPLARRLLPNLEGAPPPALVMPMVRLRWELREARSTLGLSRLRPADLLLQPGDLNIVTLPDQFQPPTGGALDERFVFVGPSILQRDERAYFSLKQIEAQPTVFVSLGAAYDERIAELYRGCLEAFGSSRWLVVMETGPGTDSALLGQTPPNVIAWPRVPRLEVLRRCDVFVTDGDVGATMEALWFGVPLVVVPRTPEQNVAAERVKELRMGIVLDPKVTGADGLREAVDDVGADPSYHAGLADLWVAARHAGGHRLAADRIQSFVQHARASS
jgi:MGT family glycosyltransferase